LKKVIVKIYEENISWLKTEYSKLRGRMASNQKIKKRNHGKSICYLEKLQCAKNAVYGYWWYRIYRC